MTFALTDIAHVGNPFFYSWEALLEALNLGQGQSIRDLIVIDDINYGRFTRRDEELATFQHLIDSIEDVTEESLLGGLDLVTSEVSLAEGLRTDDNLRKSLDAGLEDGVEPVQVLVDQV